MNTYLVAFVLALAVSATITPFVVWLAIQKGWLDQPSEARKVHRKPVPRLGGLAVVAGFMAPLVALMLYENRVSRLVYEDQGLVAGLLFGGLLIVLLGVFDDIRGSSARQKLAVQTLAVVIIWQLGFRVEILGLPLGEQPVSLGMLSFPLTWLWVVGIINAMNLIDGLDGLASGIALLATFVLFCVALNDNAVVLCLLTACLGGAVVGFLFFNFNPARIFLGDSGSMFLGFVLAAVSIWTQRKETTAITMFVPILALGLPILDTGLSFFRRLCRGTHPFKADREHVHHRLMALGLSHRSTVLTLYTASAVFSLGAIALLSNDGIVALVVAFAVVAVVVMLVRRIGLVSIPDREDPVLVAARPMVRRASRRIRSATSPEDVWSATSDVLQCLGATDAQLCWALDSLRSDNSFDSLTTGADSSTCVRALRIEENGVDLGQLTLSLPPRVLNSRSAEGYIELLSDALAEFAAERAKRAAARPDLNLVELAPRLNARSP